MPALEIRPRGGRSELPPSAGELGITDAQVLPFSTGDPEPLPVERLVAGPPKAAVDLRATATGTLRRTAS